MARPKKPEERARIRDVAFNVFSSKGFENSSFSDIAKEASVSKSLVQYYFPKKEQFISDFIDKSMSSITKIVREDLPLICEHELGELYAIGYCQFYFAMQNEKMNALRIDILRDRRNSEMIARHGIKWLEANTRAVQVETPEEITACENTMAFVAGGAFDYLYSCMVDEKEPDVAFLADTALALLNPFLNVAFHEGAKVRDQISDEWLEKARRKYNRMMFTIL